MNDTVIGIDLHQSPTSTQNQPKQISHQEVQELPKGTKLRFHNIIPPGWILLHTEILSDKSKLLLAEKQ